MCLPGGEDLFVLQLLHAGGGGHRHGDHDVVDVEGAFASPPFDWLLLEERGTSQRGDSSLSFTVYFTLSLNSTDTQTQVTDDMFDT